MKSAPVEPAHTEVDWAERYRDGNTPWDLGMPHPELVAGLDSDQLGRRRLGHGARAIVPGCGKGHDAVAFARAGWFVTAVDVVPELGRSLAPQLELFGGRFVAASALDYMATPPFDLLWEHTFFCALPRELRPAYGDMARRLVGFRGRLVALVFPFDRPLAEGGPPWQMTTQDLADALGDGFALRNERALKHPAPGRAWQERWAVFERLDDQI
ncbi:MAG TPA: thiopurine S-methyltransferase [Planctomycetota bacterium]